MALLFDLIASQPTEKLGRFHGGSEYAKALFVALAERASASEVIGFYNPKYPIDPHLLKVVRDAGFALHEVATNDDIQALLDTEDVSAFYSALLVNAYLRLDLQRVHYGFTLHDLRPLEVVPDRGEWVLAPDVKGRVMAVARILLRGLRLRRIRANYERFLRQPARSTRIYVPSYHTKYALLTRFPWLNPETISVAFSPPKPVLGSPLSEEATEALLGRLGVASKKYVLLLSADRWLKNGLRATQALDHLYEVSSAFWPDTLVLGVSDPAAYRARLRHTERFSFADYVETEELEALYKHAFVLLYPTLHEGFGYPPLECMKHGTPVVSSAITSTTELYGDSALYVNPFSEEEIQNRLLRLALEPDTHQSLGEKGRKRAYEMEEQQADMLDDMVSYLLKMARSEPLSTFNTGAPYNEAHAQ